RKTGRRRVTYATGAKAVHASFARDGTVLMTGQDGRMRLVDPQGDIRKFASAARARNAALSPDGSLIAAIGRTGVQLIDVKTGAVRRTVAKRSVASAAISANKEWLLTGGLDEKVLLWEVKSGRRLRAFPHNEKHAVSVAFSPSRRLVASASTDN